MRMPRPNFLSHNTDTDNDTNTDTSTDQIVLYLSIAIISTVLCTSCLHDVLPLNGIILKVVES